MSAEASTPTSAVSSSTNSSDGLAKAALCRKPQLTNTRELRRSAHPELVEGASALASSRHEFLVRAEATRRRISVGTETLSSGRNFGLGRRAALPVPNLAVTSPILYPNGKLALTTTTTPLFEQCPTGVVDLVGFGTGTVNCSEGNMPLDTPLAPTAWSRKGTGATNACTDTNSNGADFELRTPSPKNTSSAVNACSRP